MVIARIVCCVIGSYGRRQIRLEIVQHTQDLVDVRYGYHARGYRKSALSLRGVRGPVDILGSEQDAALDPRFVGKYGIQRERTHIRELQEGAVYRIDALSRLYHRVAVLDVVCRIPHQPRIRHGAGRGIIHGVFFGYHISPVGFIQKRAVFGERLDVFRDGHGIGGHGLAREHEPQGQRLHTASGLQFRDGDVYGDGGIGRPGGSDDAVCYPVEIVDKLVLQTARNDYRVAVHGELDVGQEIFGVLRRSRERRRSERVYPLHRNDIHIVADIYRARIICKGHIGYGRVEIVERYRRQPFRADVEMHRERSFERSARLYRRGQREQVFRGEEGGIRTGVTLRNAPVGALERLRERRKYAVRPIGGNKASGHRAVRIPEAYLDEPEPLLDCQEDIGAFRGVGVYGLIRNA